MRKVKEFTWLDAEIAWAISCFEKIGGANAEDIVTCVDSRQHMLLSKNQLSRSLNILKRAGFVEEKDGRYFVPNKVLAGRSKTALKRKSYEHDYFYTILGLKREKGKQVILKRVL